MKLLNEVKNFKDFLNSKIEVQNSELIENETNEEVEVFDTKKAINDLKEQSEKLTTILEDMKTELAKLEEVATVDTSKTGEDGIADMKSVDFKHKKVSKNISKELERKKHDKPISDIEDVAKHNHKKPQQKVGTTPNNFEKDKTPKQVNKTTA